MAWGFAGLVGLVAAVGSARAAEPAVDWQPQRTWVFAVGLLEWERPDLLAGFPAARKNRSDGQLVRLFREAGVPDDQVVFLKDAAATKARIRRELRALLEQTRPGDLLIAYYAGHGIRHPPSGRSWFAPYDASEEYNTYWSVAELVDDVEARFAGERVWLLADCCHSGALVEEARRRQAGPLHYAALASVHAHDTSTGAWTFTDALLSALRGDPRIDADGDGLVELDETADYVEREMAFVDGQKASFFAETSFPLASGLARTVGRAAPRVGEHVEAFDDVAWYRAQIIAVDGDRVKVHYVGYGDEDDDWRDPKDIRPYRPRALPEGTQVSARAHDGKWYPATVIEAWYGLHRVRYDGYGPEWDEWLGPGAVKPREASGRTGKSG